AVGDQVEGGPGGKTDLDIRRSCGRKKVWGGGWGGGGTVGPRHRGGAGHPEVSRAPPQEGDGDARQCLVKDCARRRNEPSKKCPTARNRLGQLFLRNFKNIALVSHRPSPWDWDTGTFLIWALPALLGQEVGHPWDTLGHLSPRGRNASSARSRPAVLT